MRDHLEASAGLWLRRWSAADAPSVLAAFAEPLMERQAREPVVSLEAAERWLAGQAEQWGSGTAFAFAVVDAADSVVGNVAVRVTDRRHRTGWVSYWTTASARGQGVASHASRALARWAFDELDLFRLELAHRVDNPASCKVARAAGFAVEGVERRRLEYDGVRYDVERHARLATDDEPPCERSSRA
ncbi:GNAT family N-acetyltransferase [Streptomyces sp. RY43-2]|uniref:GNAT family N-acetyltransferase n=1 Tax=Streptomyces macrolidinus TaxID=2952607 RepID=A0ABT0ZHA2_9ACTN|nr:GNAT family N-acetyltransferase [Streptomyces macrolidinus]MCN9242940.1 GNAT family N-acetyltransferase [Streptomyces macrolidinus]